MLTPAVEKRSPAGVADSLQHLPSDDVHHERIVHAADEMISQDQQHLFQKTHRLAQPGVAIFEIDQMRQRRQRHEPARQRLPQRKAAF